MSNKIFTATYLKGDDLVLDISIRNEVYKKDEIENFADQIKSSYGRCELDIDSKITTILIYLSPNESEKVIDIIDSFYNFME